MRLVSLIQAGLGILDIVAFFCSTVVFLTLWRSRELYLGIKAVFDFLSHLIFYFFQTLALPSPSKRIISYYQGSILHRVVFVSFAKLIVDIMLIPLFVLLALAPWRLWHLITNWKNVNLAPKLSFLKPLM